jgi:hypothetical protein
MISFLIVDDNENLASELRRLLADLFPVAPLNSLL